MADEEPFYAPFKKPPPPRKSSPGELVWTLRKGADEERCELRHHPGWGWETQLLSNGQLRYGQRFVTREHAEQEAADLRSDLERDGWA